MASNLKTAQDLLNILDAIYEKSSRESYTPMRLYIDTKSKTSKIFLYQENNKLLYSAILDPEGFVIDSNTFLVRTYQNCVATSVESTGMVYDSGVGAYVDVDLLIKNISACLGVAISDNIQTDSPTIYNDLKSIILNYYTEDSRLEYNFPSLLRKGLKGNETSYKSYIPAMLILEFCVYFNNLGIYNKFETVSPYNFKFGKYYKDFETEDFNEFSKKFIKSLNYNTSVFNDVHIIALKSVYNIFMDLHGNEIDFNQNYVILIYNCGSSTNPNKDDYFDVNFGVKVLPKNISIYSTSTDNNTSLFLASGSNQGSDKIISDSNINIISFNFTVNCLVSNNQYSVINDDKDVKEITKGTLTRIEFNIPQGSYYPKISNLKSNKILRCYTDGFSYILGNLGYINYNNLSNNFLLNQDEFIDLLPISPYDFYKILNHFNLDLNNLIYYFCRKNISGLDVFESLSCAILVLNTRNVGVELKYISSSGYTFSFLSPVGNNWLTNNIDHSSYNSYNSGLLVKNPYITYIALNDCTFSMYIYNKKLDTFDKLDFEFKSGEPIIFNFDNNYLENVFDSDSLTIISNFGKLVDLSASNIQGISLLNDAIYPSDVNTLYDLHKKYPDWWNYFDSNPYLEDGVLNSSINTEYLACSVMKNINTQELAQAAKIQIDQIEDIIKDIDLAQENNDSEPDIQDADPSVDPDVDPNSNKPSINSGDTPDIEDINNLPNILASGSVKQYRLTSKQVLNLFNNLNSNDTWTAISKLISNPLDFVISLQAGYICQHVGESLQNIAFGPYTFNDTQGYKLNGNYVDLNAGTINLAPYFEDYNDIINTEVELYLPYVGYVTLEVDKFIRGSIKLQCRVDTLTGSIVYFVYSLRDGCTQLLNTFQGNCQFQVPLNSTDFSKLYSDIFSLASKITKI